MLLLYSSLILFSGNWKERSQIIQIFSSWFYLVGYQFDQPFEPIASVVDRWLINRAPIERDSFAYCFSFIFLCYLLDGYYVRHCAFSFILSCTAHPCTNSALIILGHKSWFLQQAVSMLFSQLFSSFFRCWLFILPLQKTLKWYSAIWHSHRQGKNPILVL